ncbi:MAG TPA: tol-pal system protein YbgF, partial [Thermoanaerobaculia bacterium]|nr:tol-pal system protein YbgF [Thermoanaerobaculia bacterium]
SRPAVRRTPPLLLACALALGGCASAMPETPGQRREAEIDQLKERVLELARQAAVAESEIARLRQQVASLEARLGGRGTAAAPARPSSQAPATGSRGAASPAATPAPPSARPLPPSARAAPPVTPSSAGRPALEESDLDAEPLAEAPPPARPAAPAQAPPPRQPTAPVAGARSPAPAPGGANQPVPREAQAVYDDAYTLFHQGRFEDSERRFEEFLAVAPPTELSDNAQYWIGAARYERGDHRSALAAFRRTVELYPDGNKVPDALFKMGQALEELGDPGEALGVYRELARRYPETAAAALALERIDALPRR